MANEKLTGEQISDACNHILNRSDGNDYYDYTASQHWWGVESEISQFANAIADSRDAFWQAEVERKSDAIQRLWAERDAALAKVKELEKEARERIDWLMLHLKQHHGCTHMDANISGIPAWLAAIASTKETK